MLIECMQQIGGCMNAAAINLFTNKYWTVGKVQPIIERDQHGKNSVVSGFSCITA